MATSSIAETAMHFLCRRNPFEDIEQIQWVYLLMDTQDKLGDEAIIGLAGFYLWAIGVTNEGKPADSTAAIMECFSHDIGERNTKCMLPRSDSYQKFWIAEHQKYNPQ